MLCRVHVDCPGQGWWLVGWLVGCVFQNGACVQVVMSVSEYTEKYTEYYLLLYCTVHT